MFWTIIALVTLAAAFAVMWPFLAATTTVARRDEHAVEVYRDQLYELERDVDRGLISREEAAEARAELGRRILSADTQTEEMTARRRSRDRLARVIAIAAVLFVPAASWAVYGYLGSPDIPAQPLAARKSADPAQASIQELVARAEAQLALKPDDVRGWKALAPIYARLGRFDDAERAYRRILALEGDDAATYALLGEALVGAAKGVVEAEAEEAFEVAVNLDPKNPRARFYLALAQAQDGREDDARDRLQALTAELPEDSPWKAAARSALASFEPAENAGVGPLRTNAEQQAMIDSMVAGLDQRLRENPDDPEGWRRLLRSLSVLERKDDAQAALERAVEAFGAESEEAEMIRNYARTLPVFSQD